MRASGRPPLCLENPIAAAAPVDEAAEADGPDDGPATVLALA